jgi:hypothetical protein
MPGCRVCEHLWSNDRQVVFDAGEFRGYVSEDYPWAVIVATKRHECDGPWALNDAEAAELGSITRRVSAMIRRAGHDWMYAINFGDNTPKAHYHVGFFTPWHAIPEAVHEVFRARVGSSPVPGMELAVELATEMGRHFA